MYRTDYEEHSSARGAAEVNAHVQVGHWEPRPPWIALACKRTIDIGGSLAFFLLFGWLFLGLWLAVALKQGRPAIYKHRRVGLHGKEFDCLKFRSMLRNADEVLTALLASSPEARAEWEQNFKLRFDPRVTPFGAFLRRTSLDELPQFWNVLRGDMSLVGPRPIVKKEIEEYYRASAREYVRVKPGITGPWQISGRNDVTYADRIAMDCEYAKSWTNTGDLVMLFKTFYVVLRQKGSY